MVYIGFIFKEVKIFENVFWNGEQSELRFLLFWHQKLGDKSTV